MMPPPGSGAPPLTHDEKMLFARWIDLGAPINSGEETGDGDFGWFLDDLRPTLTVSSPRAGINTGEVDVLRIGMADVHTGIDAATFSVKMDIPIEGRAAMDELADLFVEVWPGVHELSLSSPLPPAVDRHLFTEVADVQGNFKRLDVEFTVEDPSNAYHVLTVDKTGAGQGTIVSTPGGIFCGLDCEQSYLAGTLVVLDAQPQEGSLFTGWSGDGDCLDGQVTMTADLTCTADFFRQPLLSITLTGTGSGQVNSSQGGLDCPPDCEEAYDPGTVLTLGSVPDPDSMFISWSGDPDCSDGTLTMDDDRSCVGQFELAQPLTITLDGTGGGTITTTPGSINCPADCDEDFANGTVVTLVPTPDPGSEFLVFTGGPECASGVVTMDEAHSCTAFFNLMPVLTMGFSGNGSGHISSAPAGIDCGTDCTEVYFAGTVVTLTATPDVGSTFVQWKGVQPDCIDGVLTMNNNRDCMAEFELQTHTVTVTKAGTGSGSVSSDPGGINCGSNCSEDWGHGTEVTLTANPNSSSEFVGWSGHADCADGELTVTEPITCQATFDLLPPDFHTLTMSKNGSGSGTVTSDPAGIDCGTDCTESYEDGTVVTLTATPDAGSVFSQWKGVQPDCIDGVLTMNNNRDCMAEFELQTHTVTVTKAGTGSGSVSSDPGGINCGSNCSEDWGHGTEVTLTANPNSSSEFVGWSGHADCADGVLTVTEPMTCQATFDLVPPGNFALAYNVIGTGSGTVTSNPPGIDCGPDCSESYPDGTVVTMMATPDVGSAFKAWGGSHPDCDDGVLTMTGNRNCTAEFELQNHTVNVSKAGTGSGTVTSSPTGINCGSDCSEDWGHSTVVTLTPSPDAGSEFAGWSGHADCADGVLTVTEPMSCQATFDLLPPPDHTLTISKQGNGSGTVTSSPAGIDCGSDCSEDFTEGTAVTLGAGADPGSSFTGWSGDPDCNDGVVTMNGGRNCTAEFQLQTHAVSVSKSGTGSGTVTSSPAGIDCGSDCSEDFDHGAVVTLTPSPDAGSVFADWSGHADCADGELTVTGPRSCQATFDLLPPGEFALTMSHIGTGSGTVTSNPAGIDCGTDCVESYTEGTVVTLTATPDVGSVFKQWKGSQADCLDGVITMSADRDCAADWDVQLHTVTVTKAGNGSGTVTSSPGGINCGSNCSEDWSHGTVVTLTASPNSGSEFAGWSGHADCADGVLTVTEPMSCEATFDLLPPPDHTLTVSKQGNGSGTVTSSPAGIDCGSDCQEDFTEGTVVTLGAGADPGSSFTGWSGHADCNDGVVTMNAARDCVAEFELEQYTVAVSKAGAGSGTVTSSPAGIDCGSDCSENFDHGTVVNLTPSPDPDSEFVGWSGHADCADGVLTMNGDRTCVAEFELQLGASVTGMTLRRSVCNNFTTGQSGGEKGVSGIASWTCHELGVLTSTGDRVQLLGRGTADGSGPVGGTVSGFAFPPLRKVICQNRTTAHSVQFITAADSWDCEAEGLIVDPGNQVIQSVVGVV